MEADETGRYQTRGRWAFVDAARMEGHIGSGVLQTGRTAGLAVPERVLSGRLRTGTIALTSRRLVLTPDAGLPDAYALRHVIQTLRFRNGIVVRTQAGRHVYLDPGDDLEPLYAVLYRTLHDG